MPPSFELDIALTLPLVAEYSQPFSVITTYVLDYPVGGLALLVQLVPPSVLRYTWVVPAAPASRLAVAAFPLMARLVTSMLLRS